MVASDFPITLTNCNMLYYYSLIIEAVESLKQENSNFDEEKCFR